MERFKRGLTAKQLKVLEFLRKWETKNKIAPSVRDIASGMGYKTPSTVHAILVKLFDKGYIEMGKNEARSVKVINE